MHPRFSTPRCAEGDPSCSEIRRAIRSIRTDGRTSKGSPEESVQSLDLLPLTTAVTEFFVTFSLDILRTFSCDSSTSVSKEVEDTSFGRPSGWSPVMALQHCRRPLVMPGAPSSDALAPNGLHVRRFFSVPENVKTAAQLEGQGREHNPCSKVNENPSTTEKNVSRRTSIQAKQSCSILKGHYLYQGKVNKNVEFCAYHENARTCWHCFSSTSQNRRGSCFLSGV